MKLNLKTVAALGALAICSTSYGAYRCGNVFQDRPCDAATAQTAATRAATAKAAVPSAAAVAAPAANSPFAAVCTRLGKSAMDVIWTREAGSTKEKQLQKSPGYLSADDYANMVEAVYARRGSAPEIRASIEADCIAEKQRAADTAAAIAALQQGAKPVAQTPVVGVPVVGVPAAPASAEAKTAPVQASNTARCDSLMAERSDLQSRARQGGGIGTMEQINNQRRSVDTQISQAKCK
jgi:hypothetical protein